MRVLESAVLHLFQNIGTSFNYHTLNRWAKKRQLATNEIGTWRDIKQSETKNTSSTHISWISSVKNDKGKKSQEKSSNQTFSSDEREN